MAGDKLDEPTKASADAKEALSIFSETSRSEKKSEMILSVWQKNLCR